MRKDLIFVAAITCPQALLSSAVQAQSNDITATLALISITANQICGVVRDTGSATSVVAKGAVNVELRGLATNLNSAGLQGGGEISTTEYIGVVQGQLAATLGENAKCKLRVFELLQFKLLPGHVSPTMEEANKPRPTPVFAPVALTCQSELVKNWLDQHGIYGTRKFDITIYDDDVIWVVNGKPSKKTKSEIAKEEDIWRKLYPVQKYTPKTSLASTNGTQCIISQEVLGYKQSSTGKVELNNFRFGFTIQTDSGEPRIVGRETDVRP